MDVMDLNCTQAGEEVSISAQYVNPGRSLTTAEELLYQKIWEDGPLSGEIEDGHLSRLAVNPLDPAILLHVDDS